MATQPVGAAGPKIPEIGDVKLGVGLNKVGDLQLGRKLPKVGDTAVGEELRTLDDAPKGKGLMHTSPPAPLPSPKAHLGNQLDVMA